MLIRAVVSSGSSSLGSLEMAERDRVVAALERDQARRALRDGARRLGLERFLAEELGGVDFPAFELSERELGKRVRVVRVANQRLLRLLDRLVDLPRFAQRRDERRPRECRLRVRLDERAEHLGGPVEVAEPAPHLAERHDDVLGVRGEPVRLGKLLFGSSEIARLGEQDAEVVATFPELTVGFDGLLQELDRLASTVFRLRGVHALGELRDGHGVCRRERGRRRLLLAATAGGQTGAAGRASESRASFGGSRRGFLRRRGFLVVLRAAGLGDEVLLAVPRGRSAWSADERRQRQRSA